MALSDGGIGILLSTQLNPADISKIESQINQLQNKISRKPINPLGDTSSANSSKKILDAYGNVLSTVKTNTDAFSKSTKGASDSIKNANVNIQDTVRSTKELSQGVLDVISKFSKWYLIAGVVTTVIGGLTGVVETVKSLNDVMVDLQMATGYDAVQAKGLLSSYNSLAKEMGSTTVDTAKAANSYLRQGKSIEETNTLIKDSLILSKVGMLDSAEATTYLTSIMLGYKISVEDVIGVVDKLAAVDMISASDAGQLATAMQSVSNIANSLGVDLDELIGYLGTVISVTQKSADSVGNSFKTIFTRMSNVKIGKFLSDEGEDLSNVESILSSVGIKLRSDAETWRDFGDVLDEVGGKWSTYSGVQKSAIANAFAGTRQAESFLALMSNYNTALEYTTVAENSAGTATEKFAYYQDSLEAATNRVTASYEAFSSALLNSDTYKTALDGTAKLLDSLTSIVDTIGAFPTLFTAAAGAMSVFSKQATILSPINISKVEGTKGLTVSSILNPQLAADREALVAYNKALGTTKNAQQAFNATMQNASLQARTFAINANGAAVNVEGFGAATVGATIKTWAMNAALSVLNATINMGIMFVISGLIQLITNLAQAQEKAREAAVESAKALDMETDAVDGYKSSVISLREELDNGNLSQEEAYNKRLELMNIQDEIISKYGEEAESIDLVTGSIEDQINAIDKLSVAAAQNWLDTNREAIQNASKYLSKTFTEKFRDVDMSGIADMITDSVKKSGGILDYTLVSDGIIQYKDYWIEFNGTIEENINSITELKHYLDTLYDDMQRDPNMDKSAIVAMDSLITDVSNKLQSLQNNKEYQNNLDIFDQFISKEAVTNYTSYYKQILDAQSAFNDAVAKGDQEGIQKATDGVNVALQAALAAVANDPEYAKELADFFNQMVKAQTDAIANGDISEGLSKEVEDFTFSLSESESAIKSYMDTLDDWRSSEEDTASAIQGLAETLGVGTEDITSNLDLIRAYAEGDRKAFEKALNAQLKLFGIKPSTGGITGALSAVAKAANDSFNKVAPLVALLSSFGLLKQRTIETPKFDKNGNVYDYAKTLVWYLPNSNIDIKSPKVPNGGSSSKSSDKSTYIDLLKQQTDIEADKYDTQISQHETIIDNIKEEIDALKEQYDTEDKLLDLERARQKLANIEAEKIRLYSAEAGGFIWTADPQAVKEQQQVIDDLQKEIDRDAAIKALEDQQKAEQAIVDQLKAKQDLLKEFVDDVGMLDDKVQDNIVSWNQLIAALQQAGIEYNNISGVLGSATKGTLGITGGGGTTTTNSDSKASAISAILKSGSKGSDVKVLQRALTALGYNLGKIDGIFGSKTASALKKFQSATGAPVTGKLDPSTKTQFAIKGFKEGGAVDYTGLANVHGSRIDPEWMYSARDVKSIMSSVPALIAQLASGNGNGGINIENMNMSSNNPQLWVRQLNQMGGLTPMTPNRR